MFSGHQPQSTSGACSHARPADRNDQSDEARQRRLADFSGTMRAAGHHASHLACLQGCAEGEAAMAAMQNMFEIVARGDAPDFMYEVWNQCEMRA